MWKRRLNSATLVNATHKELRKVVDGISTQVRVQMINRWKVKMIQKGLYKLETFHKMGIGKREKKEQYSNLNCSDTLEQSSRTHSTSSD